MSKIYKPNFTQIPNIIYDYWMRRLSPSEFVVLQCIARKTFGWQKTIDYISLRQIEEMTDISRSTITKSIDRLIELELITKIKSKDEKDGSDAPNQYHINVFDIEENTEDVQNLPGGSLNFRQGGVQNLDRGGVQNLDTQKKDLTKEISTKESEAPAQKISSSKKMKKSKPPKEPDPEKTLYLSNIYLKPEQFEKLKIEYGAVKLKEMMLILEAKIGANGYEFTSHYHVLLPNNWVHDEYLKRKIVENNLKRSQNYVTASVANSPLANKEFAENVFKKFGEMSKNLNGNEVKIIIGTSYIEINDIQIPFSEKGFKDQLLSLLRKRCMPGDKIKEVEKL